MKISVIILICITLFYSCTHTDRETENTYQVLSLLIDKFGSPIKPPPPPEGQEPYFTEIQIDSIMNKKQVIGIHRLMEKRNREEEDLSFMDNQGYKDLLNTFLSFKSDIHIDINKIKSEKNCKVIYLDSTLSKMEQHHTYDWQLFFSGIAFNDTFDKSLTTISVKHAGYFLCLLEKKNNKWYIKKSDMIYIY